MKQINGSTELLGLIGDPVAKAKTPELIAPLLASGRFPNNVVLVPLKVSQSQLVPAIEGLRQIDNFRGAVVTMPHKTSIFRLLEEATDEAKHVQACNVVRFGPDRRLFGTMLDGAGFVAGMQNQGHELKDKIVLLIGAGGAAAGIAHALAQVEGLQLTITNRSFARAQKVIAGLNPAAKAGFVTSPVAAHYDVIINATSLGRQAEDRPPLTLQNLSKGCVVCDVVVTEDETPFLRHAKSLGAKVHYGRHMLLGQLDLILAFILTSESALCSPTQA